MIDGEIDILGDPYYLVTGGIGNIDTEREGKERKETGESVSEGDSGKSVVHTLNQPGTTYEVNISIQDDIYNISSQRIEKKEGKDKLPTTPSGGRESCLLN
jgi:hypothetical protein